MTYLEFPVLFIFLYLHLHQTKAQGISFRDLKLQHTHKTLSCEEIEYVASLSNVAYTEEVLDNILIPRVVDTVGHEKVFQYIVGELRQLNWHVDIDEFKQKTPVFRTPLTFKNIVGTLNPNAERYLVFACHYDSKYYLNKQFVGAIDAAVPCAMLLNLIAVLKDRLAKIRNRTDLSLKLIFFDGEESFKENFSDDDGIYGAIHLANKYHTNHTVAKSTNEVITDLDKIDVFVLLDLIGTPNPTFYSYYNNTEKWHSRLVHAEECLKASKQLKGSAKRNEKHYFEPKSVNSDVGADHDPFLFKGVPILLLMPHEFPNTWHTDDDNRSSLDLDTIEDLNKILRVFVTEYLHLSATKKFKYLQLQHTHKTLSGDEIAYLAKLSNVTYIEEILDNILIPRAVGTHNHEFVYEYIVDELIKLKWHVDFEVFENTTDYGRRLFKNVIATLNPNAERYLVLACHYDSTNSTNTNFVAATDSAVPCAMMLNLISVLKDSLARIRNNVELNLKLIFFDGEKALMDKTYGYYGLRHLAQKYSETRTLANSTNEEITDLDKIDMFVLLELLGTSEPTFYSYFRDTERWYARLLYAEECLKELKKWKGSTKRYFEPRSFELRTEAIYPSILKGVPTLLLSPRPLPKSWETPADDRKGLNMNTIENLNKVLRVFVTEYLHLTVYNI